MMGVSIIGEFTITGNEFQPRSITITVEEARQVVSVIGPILQAMQNAKEAGASTPVPPLPKEFSVRTRNALVKRNIVSLSQLLDVGDDELWKMLGSQRSFDEVHTALAEMRKSG